MKWYEKIHQNAVHYSRKYRRSEYDLFLAIQAVDAKRVYRKMGHPSLIAYCLKELKLTESVAYGFINVARKSIEMPKIKEALEDGKVSVSQVKRVMRVITPETQDEWIDKAETLTQRELEKEIVRQHPETAGRDRIKPISDCRSEFRCGISQALEKKLERVREVLSQKTRKPASLEMALEVMADGYLEKNDPLEKAKRAQIKSQKRSEKKEQTKQRPSAPVTSPLRQPLPQTLIHEVYVRHQGKCAYLDDRGQVCGSGYFTDIHHIKPVSEGGSHSLDNLTMLCKGHHQLIHEELDSSRESYFKR